MRFSKFYLTCASVVLLNWTCVLSAEENAPECIPECASGCEVLDKEIGQLAQKYLDHPTVISGCPSCPGGTCPTPDQPPETHYYFQIPSQGSPPNGSTIQPDTLIPLSPGASPQSQIQPKPVNPNAGQVRHLGDGDESISDEVFAAEQAGKYLKPNCPSHEGYTVNFEDISIIQLIQFISRISGTNYVFDSADLNFSITIISEDATSVEDLSAALLQIFKMHGLSVVEQGNNVLIYQNQNLSRVSTVITDDNVNDACDAAVITRVFRLYNVDPARIQGIVKPLLSADAIVEISEETRHLIVSDITANVGKIADLLEALDTPNAAFDIVEYTVKSAYPTALVAYAKEILAPLSEDNPMQIIAQPASSKIFVVSTPYLNHKAIQVLKALDTADITEIGDLPPNAMLNNNFYMYKLQYQNGALIEQSLREIGSKLQFTGVANVEFVNTIYSSQWIPVNNSIVLTGSGEVIQKVVQLLRELDQAPKQVYVEVLIIDTSLQNSLDFGVQWIALGDEQDKLAFASGLLGNSPPNPNLQSNARAIASNPAANPPSIPNPGRDVPLPVPGNFSGIPGLSNVSEAFGFGIVGNILRHDGQSFLTLGALVSALDQEAATKIVLNPRLMVEDNQPASFFVGENIPYQTTSTVIQQTGSVTQNIQYEDIGVDLHVVPTIAPNNIVTLDITQAITERQTELNNLTPTTRKTLATTRVHVPDNCFLVMSGHIRDECTDIRSGIPCLGTLPLLGPIFSRTIEARNKRNLIMFIRPKVVTTIDDGICLTNQEGYQYNFETHPCSIYDCGCEQAPECETYPPPPCPFY